MPPGAEPAVYRLTPRARADLLGIWFHTADAFSVEQAEHYQTGLVSVFDLIARNPDMGREWREVDPPIRLHSHRSHIVAYRIQTDHVLIIRVLHGREDWAALIAAPDPPQG